MQLVEDRSARLQSMRIDSKLFIYDELPECALSCKILQISEANCVPPTAPVSNHVIYQDCICQSTYLRSLHASGVLCHGVCTDMDNEIIHQYYNRLCGPSKLPKTTTSHLPPPSTLSTVATVHATYTTVQIPTISAPPSIEAYKAGNENQQPWYIA
jgi:hypothetical protein